MSVATMTRRTVASPQRQVAFVGSDEPLGYPDGLNAYTVEINSPVGVVDPMGLETVTVKPSPATQPANPWPAPPRDPVSLVPDGYRAHNGETDGAHLKYWAAKQREELGIALKALAPPPKPPGFDEEAQQIADAIVGAVLKERLGGDQPGGWLSTWMGFVYNACGDWQGVVGEAANNVIDQWARRRQNSFVMKLKTGTGPWKEWHQGVPRHQWVAIGACGSGKTAVVDPWPTGGSGSLLDNSASGAGWTTVK